MRLFRKYGQVREDYKDKERGGESIGVQGMFNFQRFVERDRCKKEIVQWWGK